jgi:hypothetical protein
LLIALLTALLLIQLLLIQLLLSNQPN